LDTAPPKRFPRGSIKAKKGFVELPDVEIAVFYSFFWVKAGSNFYSREGEHS